MRVGYSNSNTELISKYFGGGIIYKLKDTSTLEYLLVVLGSLNYINQSLIIEFKILNTLMNM